MASKADLEILQYGQKPNIIITEDRASMLDAQWDCSACGSYMGAAWIALVPSLSDSGYRVVSFCTPCTEAYVADGLAVDRRPRGGTDGNP